MTGMEAEVVKTFHNELVSLYELKPPISKNKIQEITKAAIRAIRYYKHVVFGVEKFLTKCKPEYKLPGMYCIDSIIRQSQHQYKEKDVFAGRFSINMLQTVVNLMTCKAEDMMKIVRVMNLWIVQKVYEEEVVRPWLEYCRTAHGVDTDFFYVEKVVKGEAANYALYDKVVSADEKRKSSQIQSPPLSEGDGRKEILPHTPPLETNDEVVEGGISEKETLEIITNMNMDLGGMFTQDTALLKRLHKIINDKLVERRELDSRRQGNIKNLLSREFDYSDEEDSGDDESKRLQVETRPTELTKQQIRGMAETVLRDEVVKEEIQRMHTERLTAMSQTTIPQFQPPPIEKPHPIVNAPINIPLNAIEMETSAPALPSLPPMPSPIRPPPLMSLPLQPPQMCFGGPSGMPSFPPNMLPPGFSITNAPHHNVPMQNQMNDHMEIDQDDRLQRSEDRFDIDHDARDRRDYRGRDRRDDKRRSRFERDERDHEREKNDFRDYDSRPAKKTRRSRSKEREDSRKERRHSPSDDRRSRSRGRDRDLENSTQRDAERQRRKMGIPWPPKEDHLLIASCTLWLGRLPSSCSEEDIRASVIEAGEPKRINIISSRACAYVTMKDRKAAFRVMEKLQRNMQVAKKNVKLSWGIGQGLKEKYADCWDVNSGITQIPYSKLPEDLESLLEGGQLDLETLPPNLAGLYNDYGFKSKKSDAVNGASHEIQSLPSLASISFPANQPPAVMGGAYFPPMAMALPGFPPGIPPPVGPMAPPPYLPKTSPGDGKFSNARGDSESGSQEQQFQQNLRFPGRPPIRGPNFNSGTPPFLPRGYPVPNAGRFPRVPGFRGGPSFRGARPGFMPRPPEAGFRGRPRFPGGQFPGMDTAPPRYYNPGLPGIRAPRPLFPPNEGGENNVELAAGTEHKENYHEHQHHGNGSDTDNRHDKNPMDTSVSSTTCEDENPIAVVEINSASKSSTDSKMAVTKKEDDLLENPIIYDPEDDE